MDYTCTLEVWKSLNTTVRYEEGTDLEKALKMKDEYRKEAIMYAAKNGCRENVLYCIIQHDDEIDNITNVCYFKNTFVTRDDIEELIVKNPNAEFGIIYAKSQSRICNKIYEEEKSKHIGPITLKEANKFVTDNHRHHDSVTGCKFAIGLYKTVDGEEKLIGTAICGRPVSRELDNGYTLEVNRLCVTEKNNGNDCSMLYGACCRIAKEMGYRKIITYILESESGTSLKASNFILESDRCGGKNWTGSRKRKNNTIPEEMKQRWVKDLAS